MKADICKTMEAKIVGKIPMIAQADLLMHGYQMRISIEDGVSKMGTCEFSPDRMNVEVENNIVKSIICIG